MFSANIANNPANLQQPATYTDYLAFVIALRDQFLPKKNAGFFAMQLVVGHQASPWIQVAKNDLYISKIKVGNHWRTLTEREQHYDNTTNPTLHLQALANACTGLGKVGINGNPEELRAHIKLIAFLSSEAARFSPVADLNLQIIQDVVNDVEHAPPEIQRRQTWKIWADMLKKGWEPKQMGLVDPPYNPSKQP